MTHNGLVRTVAIMLASNEAKTIALCDFSPNLRSYLAFSMPNLSKMSNELPKIILYSPKKINLAAFEDIALKTTPL